LTHTICKLYPYLSSPKSNNFRQEELYDGSLAAIEQTVTVCPKKKYTIWAWAASSSKKDKCYLQVCDGISGKCSREATITRNGVSVSTHFHSAETQTSAQLQVYLICHGTDDTHVNTLFVDQVGISVA